MKTGATTPDFSLGPFVTSSPAETQALGEALGKGVERGAIIGLIGDLGAGKTCFTKGLARGLGVDENIPVVSPTYTLVNEYPGDPPLVHIDCYRLNDPDELEFIGWRDQLNRAVLAIEWFDTLRYSFGEQRIEVEISRFDEEKRRVTIAAWGQSMVQVVRRTSLKSFSGPRIDTP